MLERISIQVPFDAHVHFRQGEVLKTVVPFTAKHFWGACAMPNTDPPILTAEAAIEYRRNIEDAARRINKDFVPLVGLYLTDTLHPDEVKKAYVDLLETKANMTRRAAEFLKFYPKGGTTNSKYGVVDIMSLRPQLEIAEKIGIPVCLHGEKVLKQSGSVIDHLDRERYFVEGPLEDLLHSFPGLRVVLEHISTREGIERVWDDESGRLAGSITAHHPMFTHVDLFEGGMRPHLNNMPIFKHEADRRAIRQAMFSGDKRFFAGSDSAPHPESKKHSACCPFGIFSAPGLLERYATIWSDAGKLKTPDDVIRFNNFMSLNGPYFYGFEPHTKTIDLIREEWSMTEPVYLRLDTDTDQTFHGEYFHPLGAHPGLIIPFTWKVSV